MWTMKALCWTILKIRNEHHVCIVFLQNESDHDYDLGIEIDRVYALTKTNQHV